MAHGQVQGAVASHREAADPACISGGDGPVVVVNKRDKFLNEEILVAVLAVLRVDIESLSAIGQDHDELPDCSVGRQVVKNLFGTTVYPSVVIVKQTVEKIEHGVSLAGRRVVGREINAVIHRVVQNFAGDRIALDDGRRGSRRNPTAPDQEVRKARGRTRAQNGAAQSLAFRTTALKIIRSGHCSMGNWRAGLGVSAFHVNIDLAIARIGADGPTFSTCAACCGSRRPIGASVDVLQYRTLVVLFLNIA